MTNNQNIDKLLVKFYDASISQEEIDILFDYFLYTDPLPECYSADVELIRGLAIMRYCHKTKSSFEKSLIEKERKTRNAFAYKMVKCGVAFAACVAALVVGLWQVRTKSAFIPYAHEVVQPAPTMLATQTTDMPTTPILQHTDSKPAAITNNDIKNKITDVLHSDSSVQHPDTIAAPPTMAPQPLLLAEAEPETKPEPNYNDNNYTDYLIADASIEKERQLTELQMYCSTRCSSNEVSVAYFDVMGENFI